MKREYGRTRWNRLKDSKKTVKVKELLKDMNIEESLKLLSKYKNSIGICTGSLYLIGKIRKKNLFYNRIKPIQ